MVPECREQTLVAVSLPGAAQQEGKCETIGVLMSIENEKERKAELASTRNIVDDMENRERFLNSMNQKQPPHSAVCVAR